MFINTEFSRNMWCEDDGKWLLLLVLVRPKIKHSSVLERDVYNVYYSFIP